jgi:hypothetical protein
MNEFPLDALVNNGLAVGMAAGFAWFLMKRIDSLHEDQKEQQSALIDLVRANTEAMVSLKEAVRAIGEQRKE